MSSYQQQDAWLQVTNQTGTGETTADGLRIGITTTGTAHIRQQENLPMIFYANSIENTRMLPAAASTMGANVGMMGIGNFATNPNPIDAKLDIDGDLRIRTVTQDNTLNYNALVAILMKGMQEQQVNIDILIMLFNNKIL